MTEIRRRFFTILATAFLCAALWHTVRLVRAVAQTPGNSFVSYYTVSWLAVRGEFTPRAYDDAWFAVQVKRATQNPDAHDLLGPNPPPLFFVALPLVALPPQQALVVWSVLTVLAYSMVWAIGVWWWRSEALPFGWWGALGVLALILVSSPFRTNVALGQIYGFMVLLITLALYGLKREWAWWAGGALALALLFKTAGLFLLGWLLLRRQGRVVVWLLTVVSVVALLSLLWVTPDVWRAYVGAIGAVSQSSTMGVTAFQTTLGFFSHFLRHDAQWNPHPIVNLPFLVRPLYLAVTFGAVGITAWWLYRYPVGLELGAGALLALGTVSVPSAEEYHFVMMVIPVLAVAMTWVQQRVAWHDWRWAAWGVMVLMLFVPLPYEHPRLAVGWWALLAYPRLYGAWLVWLLCLWVGHSSPPTGKMINSDVAPTH